MLTSEREKGDVVFWGGRRILREMCCSAQEKEKERRTRRHRKGKMANSEEGEEDDWTARDKACRRERGGMGMRNKESWEGLK